MQFVHHQNSCKKAGWKLCIRKGSPFTYSDIADRTDFRLKLTKRGERAVLRSSPQSQDRSRVIFRINQKKKKKKQETKKERQLSSALCTSCPIRRLFVFSSLERKEILVGPEIGLTSWRYCNDEAKMKIKKCKWVEIHGSYRYFTIADYRERLKIKLV